VKLEHYRQNTNNVTFMCVRATTVAMEEQ